MSAAATIDPKLQTTAILDYKHPTVQRTIALIGHISGSPQAFLQKAHTHLSNVMRAVYSIEESTPVSRLLESNQGSCSQRMACLEALARAYGIPTRVRALWLDRTFWYSRLPLLKPLLPAKGILMPWPQFLVNETWLDFEEIYATIPDLAATASHPFTNRGESLFDAIRHAPVDFFGKAADCCPGFSLAKVVILDDGLFDTRDELLEKLDRRSWIGKLIFRMIYANRPVRRLPE